MGSSKSPNSSHQFLEEEAQHSGSDDEMSEDNESVLDEASDTANHGDESGSDDELEVGVKRKVKKRRRFIVDSDEEESSDDEVDEELEDETASENIGEVENEKPNNKVEYNEEEKLEIKKIRKEFIENEAELSGEEVSSDEDDAEDGDNVVEDEPVEDLPSDNELRNQVGKMFQKQELDEDKRKLLEMQERYLEDGDLHFDGKSRERKFRWKNADNDAWINNALETDSDDEDYVDDNNTTLSDIGPASGGLKLKQLTDEMKSTITKSKLISHAPPGAGMSMSCDFTRKFTNSARAFGGPANSIKSYIVRDEKLREALSTKIKPVKRVSTGPAKSTKKLKSNQNDSSQKSIFDFMSSLKR